MITVQVGKRIFRCSRKEADELILKAGAKVKKGIYALEQRGHIELFNAPMSATQIKRLKREYKRNGIKVYANY